MSDLTMDAKAKVECRDELFQWEVDKIVKDMDMGLVDAKTLEDRYQNKDSKKPSFYNPEEWRTTYLSMPYPLLRVNFDESEQVMIREISHKTGYPREDVVRQAVRDLYFHVCVYGGK